MEEQKLYDEGQYQKVIDQLKNDDRAEALELVAYSHQKLNQWEAAMEKWNALIAKHPDKPYFYNHRGVCKFNLRFKHAMDDFDKALMLDPSNPYFYSTRAFVKDKTGDTEGSVRDYEKAHELDPNDALILNNLGLAEQKLGLTAKARERFKNSDDLLGVKTIDSRSEPPSTPPPASTLWKELRKMVTTKEGFKDFLRDLGLLKK